MKLLKSLIAVVLGNFLYALTVKLFLLPSGLVTGGTTGLALTVNHLWNIPISTFVLLFNIAMLIVGLLCLGKSLAMTTLAGTFLYPVSLNVCEKILGNLVLTQDLLLCTIFTGLGIGISLGIVIRSGASTGGMDIPPLVLKKLFRIPVSISMYAFDVIILLTQVFFRPIENILYGIILVMIYTLVLDRMLLIGGGYTHQDMKLILSIISNRELFKVEKIARDIDPESFLIVSRVTEVRGHGFSSKKVYQ